MQSGLIRPTDVRTELSKGSATLWFFLEQSPCRIGRLSFVGNLRQFRELLFSGGRTDRMWRWSRHCALGGV
jgi:hypothetical protein